MGRIFQIGNLILRLRKVWARSGQGWDKVWTRLGQGLDKKQGLGRQGRGKVETRSGQKARFGRGLGKLAAIPTPITSPCLTLPQRNLAPTLPRCCPNLAPTLRRRSIKMPSNSIIAIGGCGLTYHKTKNPYIYPRNNK